MLFVEYGYDGEHACDDSEVVWGLGASRVSVAQDDGRATIH